MVYSSLIGARVRRKEDPHLLTGNGTYVANLNPPNLAHVAFVRSPYAHARINSIDASAALHRPGVLAVMTGQDLVSSYEPMAMTGEDDAAKAHTHYALSVDRVRHTGETVAAVVATSPEIAEDAVQDVVVDWEPLPVVATLQQAVEAGAPLLFDDMTDNIEHTWVQRSGDVDGAFSRAFRVVRQQMVNQRLAGVPMEGRAIVAAPDPLTGGLTVWASTQIPHGLRTVLADALRLPENSIRVIAPDVGGGFGLKGAAFPEDVAVAAMARILQRPLRWLETRLENLLTTTHGRGQIADLEAAVQEDGTVMALRMRILGDLGAYPVINIIPELTGWMAVGVYRIPAVDIEIKCIYTNTVPVAAYRGAGRPEAAYYIERMMDLIADELRLDAVQVRRKNFIPPDAFPYKTPTDKTYDSGNYDGALTKALEIAHYTDLRAEQARRTQNSDRLLGIGVACYVEVCGFGPYESAVVRVEPSGTVTVYTGLSPHGQGQETTFAQMVADRIGANYDQIIVRHGDTATMPQGIGTFGSRGLVVGGSAIERATQQVRLKAQQIVAHMLEAAPEDIVLKDGHYHVRGVPDRSVTLAQIAKRAYSDDLPHDLSIGLEATDFFRPASEVYPFGTHIAVVEVERETGLVHLVNYFSVDDCGPRISPLLVEGQIHGGLAQGIAQALLEEVVYDEQGQLLSGSLVDYALPRADVFPHFTLDHTETPTPLNPLGVKGIGEAATIGSTPAIANAVLDALKPFGVRHIDIPLRAEKVWRAMQQPQ
jgi:carbon-monoxide dehydrogenase large subunit